MWLSLWAVMRGKPGLVLSCAQQRKPSGFAAFPSWGCDHTWKSLRTCCRAPGCELLTWCEITMQCWPH